MRADIFASWAVGNSVTEFRLSYNHAGLPQRRNGISYAAQVVAMGRPPGRNEVK